MASDKEIAHVLQEQCQEEDMALALRTRASDFDTTAARHLVNAELLPPSCCIRSSRPLQLSPPAKRTPEPFSRPSEAPPLSLS